MFTNKMLIAVAIIAVADAHGFLSKPVSRNAVGDVRKGYCKWSGGIGCFGDFMSLGGTTGPDSTGCTNSGNRGAVTGSGTRSFGSTGIKTEYTKGQIMDVEIDITAYHGGKFVFKLQDVGTSNDPNGALWENLTPLSVLEYSPDCGDACPVKEPCAPSSQGGSGATAGTCAQIPLAKGSHSGKYSVRVQLPDDMTCEHCVLQWHWTSSNSCGRGNSAGGLACSQSEMFWNCADLKINDGDRSASTPTPAPTPAATPAATPAPMDTPAATPAPSSTPAPAPTNHGSGGSTCHSLQAHVQDSWCQVSCAAMVAAYPGFCAMGSGSGSSRRLRGAWRGE